MVILKYAKKKKKKYAASVVISYNNIMLYTLIKNQIWNFVYYCTYFDCFDFFWTAVYSFVWIQSHRLNLLCNMFWYFKLNIFVLRKCLGLDVKLTFVCYLNEIQVCTWYVKLCFDILMNQSAVSTFMYLPYYSNSYK